jgi:hypothetical protein
MNMSEEKASHDTSERTFSAEAGEFRFKVEGLQDGYRITLNMEEETVSKQRRAFASFIQFAKLSEKAGWHLPWPIRLLLSFWAKYKKPE